MARRALAITIIAAMILSIAALTIIPTRAAASPTAQVATYPVQLVINGEPVATDVPAQLVNDRTMVPARAVFETLGAEVGWVDASRTVTVAYLEHAVSVRIGSRTATIDGHSVTLDVPPVIIGDRTLVPLRFIAEAIGARVGWIQSPRTATIDINATVVGFSWSAGIGHGTLHIDSVGAIAATAHSLSEPQRIVIDIPGASLALRDDAITEPDQTITGVSATADETGVHVTVGLAGPAGFSLAQSESGVDLRVGYRVTDVIYGRDGDNDKVLIKTSGPAAYQLTHLAGPNRLAVDFGLSGVSQALALNVDGASISDIRVAQYSADPAIARVVLEFKEGAVPVGIRRTAEGLELTVSHQFSAPLAGRTIYIDPGHGGSDPGALGVSGTHESDVNLDTAKRLQELLLNAGANAILTRGGDYKVELYSRPAMANADNADIYVSLHNNWYTSASAGGTEVYYFAGETESQRLAAAVHAALIRELGLVDRGVQTANFAVIRVAQMPSILVESAFLSNAREDRLLASPEFRQQNAQAVYDGILAYFSTSMAQ